MSRRNCHRDLEVLRRAGVPLYFDPDSGPTGSYRIKAGFFMPRIGLTDEEVLDLSVLTRVTESGSIPLLDEVSSVRDKILDTLPPQQQDLLRAASDLFEVLSVGLAEHKHSRRIMMVIQQALLTGKQISGTYRSPHQKRAVRVSLQPLRVFLGGGPAWYLVGHDNRDKATKLYRLARFQDIKCATKHIDIDRHFSLREFLGNAWGVYRGERDWHIEIKFSANVAEQVAEVHWHHTQQLERCKDGSLIFRATVSGLEEITSWILQYGNDAFVRKPRELAEKLAKLAQETADQYRS